MVWLSIKGLNTDSNPPLIFFAQEVSKKMKQCEQRIKVLFFNLKSDHFVVFAQNYLLHS